MQYLDCKQQDAIQQNDRDVGAYEFNIDMSRVFAKPW